MINQLYEVCFKATGSETEEVLFTTDSRDRSIFGADKNYETLNSQGSVYVKLNGEVYYTCS